VPAALPKYSLSRSAKPHMHYLFYPAGFVSSDWMNEKSSSADSYGSRIPSSKTAAPAAKWLWWTTTMLRTCGIHSRA
jgi:hypothetical protein